MIGRKMAMVGLALACATCFFAVSVASASAAEATWYECASVSSGAKYKNATCNEAGTGAGFATKEITPGTAKEIEPKLTSAAFTLASTNAGVKFKISCAGLSGSGSVLNSNGPPMTATASGVVLTFSGCTVTEPAGKGCVVEAGGTSGKIVTNSLKATGTMPTETENKVKYEPTAGSTAAFVTIKVSGCTSTALNGNKEVTGSATGISNESTGMTLQTFTSTSSALLFGGQSATFLGENDVVLKGTSTQIGLGTGA